MSNFKTRLQNRDYPARIVEKHLSEIKCDPPQEFDAKGESTLTSRLHDMLSVP